MRWLAVAAAVPVVLLAAGALLPVPSTLMLGRYLSAQPVERTWVPLASISPELVRAVIASEDQTFCSHHGIDFGALREVLEADGGPSRGASTITMQTVKNLYLWPGPSYLRKGLELPIALAVDLVWSKPRIIEVYLNVAEFGEGLFGAEAAARLYFGKPASAITRREAAALAATLPNPRLRNPQRAGPRQNTGIFRILGRMSRLGDLADCALIRR